MLHSDNIFIFIHDRLWRAHSYFHSKNSFLRWIWDSITTQLLDAVPLYFEKYVPLFFEISDFGVLFYNMKFSGSCFFVSLETAPFFRICIQACHSWVCFSWPLKRLKWKIYLLYEKAVMSFSKIRITFNRIIFLTI